MREAHTLCAVPGQPLCPAPSHPPTHAPLHTHAWAHHSTTSHCHIRSSVRLCEREAEGERLRVWREEEKGTSSLAAAGLRQPGLCGPRQATSPSCTSLLCKLERTPQDSLPPEQRWGSATKLHLQHEKALEAGAESPRPPSLASSPPNPPSQTQTQPPVPAQILGPLEGEAQGWVVSPPQGHK